MINRPCPTNIIVWSRDRSIRLLALAAMMVLAFAVDGPVARPKAYATLAEAIAATVPGGSLTQEAYIKSSNPDIEDRLGTVMAMSGDTVVVGSVPEDSNAVGVNGNSADNSMASAGAAYVFVRTPAGWIQQAYLKASNTGPDDRFGTSVAIDGDIIVVGTDFEDSNATVVNGIQSNNSATQAGAAYVFVRTGTTWTQQAYLKPSNLQAQDHFGIAVGVSGETIVVGSFAEDSAAAGVNGNQADNTASAAGAAYVFVRSGATWTQQAYLKASNPNADDYFGRTVAIDDDTILVGAVGLPAGGGEDSCATGVNGDATNNGCVNAGAVYAFVRSGTTWTQQAYLKASNSAASDLFGYSLAVNGDRAVVSALFEDGGAVVINGDDMDDSMPSAGAAYIFERSGTTWGQTAYLKSPNTQSNGFFGEYVAIDGDVVVVGHPQEASAGVMTGAVYVFTPVASGWGLTQRLTASNPAPSDFFGKSVAVSDGIVVVAAHGEDSGAAGINGDQSDNSASHSGALYAFSPSANAAPLASAGPDQVVPATSASGADVTLDGTGSTDTDGDALTYTWREGATVIGTGASLVTTVALGSHTFTVTVADGNGGEATDDVIVEVRDVLSVTAGTPPMAPATYTYGQVALASYSCNSTAGLLASCVGTVPVGSPIDTASVGTHIFEVTATNTLSETSSASWSYEVVKAGSTVTVTCPASVTYSGVAQTPCTAVVTGAGGLDEAVSVTYTNNTNAGTASASATFAGDANHESSTGTASFTITKATSTIVVTCPASVTYTGSALESCTAVVTGAGGLDEAVSVTYTNNINVGTATASATFAGDANHDSSTGSATFTIAKATSATVVTCPASVTYTGSALESCTAVVTGAGGLDEAVSVTYTNNINVGTATAAATFAGDANHDSSTGSATFTIAKATSTTVVTCPASVTYTGSALESCTAAVTGAGGLDEAVSVTYTNNTNAGAATASATFAGDANHDSSTGWTTFAITPASLTVTADDKSKTVGSIDPAFTYQVAGLLGGDTAATVLTGSLGRDPGEVAGTYTIHQGTLAANSNYTLSVATGTLTIEGAGYNLCLLYDPAKAVKSGATIPLKIRLCSATGANVSNSATVVAAVALMRVSNSATADVVDAGNSNADGNFRFDPTLGPGYIFNFKTTGLAQGTYRLEIRVTNDSQSHYLTFQVR